MILKVVVVKKEKVKDTNCGLKEKRFTVAGSYYSDTVIVMVLAEVMTVVTVVVVVEAVVVVVVEVTSHSKAGQRNFMNENFL